MRSRWQAAKISRFGAAARGALRVARLRGRPLETEHLRRAHVQGTVASNGEKQLENKRPKASRSSTNFAEIPFYTLVATFVVVNRGIVRFLSTFWAGASATRLVRSRDFAIYYIESKQMYAWFRRTVCETRIRSSHVVVLCFVRAIMVFRSVLVKLNDFYVFFSYRNFVRMSQWWWLLLVR